VVVDDEIDKTWRAKIKATGVALHIAPQPDSINHS
jgi:hypothetical protein